MSVDLIAKDSKKSLTKKACPKLLASEQKNYIGTVLLIDQDSSGTLLEYHLLFSRAGFQTIKLEHPDFLLTLFTTNVYKADLIVSNANMQVQWVNCLAMIRKSYHVRPKLRTTPVILYGKLPSGHLDFSFPDVHFITKPSPENMLTTALSILERRKFNQQE